MNALDRYRDDPAFNKLVQQLAMLIRSNDELFTGGDFVAAMTVARIVVEQERVRTHFVIPPDVEV